MTNGQLINESEALETKLKQGEKEVQVARERLKYLLSTNPGVIYTCRPSGDYGATFVSENITSQLGYEAHEFIEDSCFWADRIHPEDRPHVFAGLPDLFEKGHYTHEYRFLHKDGSYRWMHDKLKLIRDSEGNPLEIVGLWIDITDRKKMEEALRESEDKYRTIFENTGTAMIIVEEDTTISLANAEFEKLSGFSKKETEGKKSWTNFIVEEYLERMREYHRVRRIDPNAAPKNYESRFIDRRGNFRDIFITVAMIPGTKKTVASILDITELKRAEETLRKSEEKLHFLSSRFLTAQEAERKRISIELHDESGQALIALKLHLSSIQRRLRKDQKALRDECESTQRDIDQIIENVRRLSQGLSPHILENLGLSATLRWLIDDFVKKYNIDASIDLMDIDSFFSQNVQIIMYRIFQEAITNIRKHAQATNISVAISKKDDSISFLIQDDGEGFDVKEAMVRNPTEKGLGLATMEERTRMLGGSFDVRSQVGRGTRISFTIPVSKEEI